MKITVVGAVAIVTALLVVAYLLRARPVPQPGSAQ